MLAHLPSGSCFTASSKLQNSVFLRGSGQSCNASPFFFSSHCLFSCGNWYAAPPFDQNTPMRTPMRKTAYATFTCTLWYCSGPVKYVFSRWLLRKRRKYVWASVSVRTPGLVIFLRLLVCISQLPPSGRTPLPSVGMLRHTDHQLDRYCTERYCHPCTDSDSLPSVSHISELTPGVFRWRAMSAITWLVCWQPGTKHVLCRAVQRLWVINTSWRTPWLRWWPHPEAWPPAISAGSGIPPWARTYKEYRECISPV